VADRRDRPVLAGVAVGLAGAIKLYPLFLLAYFVFTRRWAGFVAGVAAFLLVNALAAAAFGVGAFRDYIGAVVPAIAGQFEASWSNLSLSGFWVRLFRSEPLRDWLGPGVAPVLGRGLAWAASFAVVAIIARTCWRADTRDKRDRAFALAVVGMLLVSPLTWPHYALLLLVPLGLLLARGKAGLASWLAVAVVAVLWLPPNFAVKVALGSEAATKLNTSAEPPATAPDLGPVSVPHYALVGLLLLVLRVPVTSPAAGGETRPRDPSAPGGA